MKILMSGGGTGGHITPILALAHELKSLKPECKIVYVGERNGRFQRLTQQSTAIDTSYSVFAGKLRRYHGELWLKRLVDIPTNLKNLRDVAYVLMGFVQSFKLLGREKPDLVFLKGGYAGVPVGLAAALRRIPIITHDSDAIPGLANRIVSRWVVLHAVALPPTEYSYPPEKTKQVGVLVEHNYQPVSDDTQAAFKQSLGIPKESPVLLVTGGSSGAERINVAVVKIVPDLLEDYPALHVIHQTGKGKASVYQDYTHERLTILEFLQPMHVYMGAADVVVSRASANTIAELGVQGKAAIVVPSGFLSGGHQLKNAMRLKEQGIAEVVTEDSLYDLQHGLLASVRRLLDDKKYRDQLAGSLQQATIRDATKRLATLLIELLKT